jgi:hypothetical protein
MNDDFGNRTKAIALRMIDDSLQRTQTAVAVSKQSLYFFPPLGPLSIHEGSPPSLPLYWFRSAA